MTSSREATRFRVWIMDLVSFGCTELAGCRSALEAGSISLSCSGRGAEDRVRCQGAVRLSLT